MLGFCFFEIEIGIAIDFLKSIDRGVFLHTIASSTQSAKHSCDAVQLDLALFAFGFSKRFSNHQNILDCGTFKGRTTSDFEVTPSISFSRFAVAFRNVQGYRLAGPKPLIPRRSVHAFQMGSFLVNPGDIGDCKAVDIKFFVSKCHFIFFRW